MPRVVFFSNRNETINGIIAQHAPSGFHLTVLLPTTSEEEQISKVQEADFLMVFGFHPSAKVFRAARKARLLQLLSAGYEKVDLALLGEMGIPVSNVGGANAEGVAEMAITLMLAVYRRILHLDRAVRQGQWLADVVSGTNTFELAEKTVGVVGLGHIGKTVVRRLRGFDVTPLYYDAISYPDAERELGARRVSMDELMRRSDIVTIHVPLLPTTQGLIGRRELSLMKPTAILINTSRGPVVDEKALIQALQEGRIAGAGLDVFEQEPINRDNPLLKMDNVVLSPHAAGSTYESWPRRARFAFQNFQRVLEGKPPLSVVSP